MEKKERNVMEELDQQENNGYYDNGYVDCDVTGLYWIDEELYPNHETWSDDPRDQLLED